MGSSPVIKYSNALIPNLARNAANLWASTISPTPGRSGSAVNYLDRRVGNIVTAGVVPAVVPSYVVWSAMTSYRVNDS